MTVLREDVDPTVNVEGGSIDIKDEAVLDSINRSLSAITAGCVITPYVALEKVRKVLAYYKIFLPQTNFLEGEDGQEVFAVSQFGLKYGMTNDGETKVKNSDDLHLYFEWSMNDHGSFDIYCEVVDNEDLEELVSSYNEDAEDDGNEDSDGAKTSYDAYRASNVNEEFEQMNEAKKDKPPFEGGYKVKGPRKDRFGNIIKTKNIAKYLAKKAEKKFVKEEGAPKLGSHNVMRMKATDMDSDIRKGWKDYKSQRNIAIASNTTKNVNMSVPGMPPAVKLQAQIQPYKHVDSEAKKDATRDKFVGQQNARDIRRNPPITVKEDNLNELSKGLLRRYTKKASWSSMAAKFDDDGAKVRRRAKGLKRAGDRLGNTMMVKKKYLAKEETINEISAEKAEKAYQKAKKKLLDNDIMVGMTKGDTQKKWLKRSNKRRDQAVKFANYAGKKRYEAGKLKEETINEISTKKAQEYVQKNSDQRWKEKLTNGKTKKRLAGSNLAKRKILGIAKVATTEETLDESKKGAYRAGYDAWSHHLTKDQKHRPTNPYKPGEGMGEWERGAADAYDKHSNERMTDKKHLDEVSYQKARNAYDKAKKQGKHEKAAKFKKYSEKKDELQARYDDLEYKGD